MGQLHWVNSELEKNKLPLLPNLNSGAKQLPFFAQSHFSLELLSLYLLRPFLVISLSTLNLKHFSQAITLLQDPAVVAWRQSAGLITDLTVPWWVRIWSKYGVLIVSESQKTYIISRAASRVGVMYSSHGPNTGSNPRGGQIPKKWCLTYEIEPWCSFVVIRFYFRSPSIQVIIFRCQKHSLNLFLNKIFHGSNYTFLRFFGSQIC